jgi:hypothetical protein
LFSPHWFCAAFWRWLCFGRKAHGSSGRPLLWPYEYFPMLAAMEISAPRCFMNSYRAIKVETGQWALEWEAEGVRQDLNLGSFATETEALIAAYECARMEYHERGDGRAHPACAWGLLRSPVRART